MPKEWLRRHRRDYYYRKAKKEEYRSRASFKLLQAVERYRFINSDDVVVDLGAAPGGWLQVARKIVGEKGFVLGVDISQIEPLGYSNVYAIVGDIRDAETAKRIKAILPHPADVIISDVSPNISGIWEVDHARQIDLAEHSLQIATHVLNAEGDFFVKVFQGDLFNRFLDRMRRFFSVVKVIKPKASRAESAEIYVLGLKYKSKS
ncbi:MAG: RlmE family RNA methyltransferase [Candidatus Bathyarchaeota archaeon]|nr:RlmE family RNA methyltransferase [Candidatus Bathyarchaeota archaeon]